MQDIECTVWCPNCETDKFQVVRRPTGRTGVYEHVIRWSATGNIERVGGTGRKDTKMCTDCSTDEVPVYLSRKE